MTDKEIPLRFPSQYIEIVEALLVARGHDPYKKLGELGIEKGRHPEAMDVDLFKALLQMSRSVANAELPVSIQLLEHFPITAHGTLGIVVMTAPNLNAALSATLRFYPVVMPAYDIVSEDAGDKIHVIFRRKVDFGDVNEILTETILGAFNSIRRHVKPDINLFEMHFSHRSGFPKDTYRSICEPSQLFFESDCNKIVLPKKHLSIELATSSKSTMAQFENQLEQQIKAVSAHCVTTAKVRAWLRKALRDGKAVSIDTVAGDLCFSARTLSRHLQQEGYSYKVLLNEERLDYSEFLVLNTNKPLSHIAHLAGFQNDSSFSRAFKRKKGLTPSEARKSLKPF